jgi:hypothetical protein
VNLLIARIQNTLKNEEERRGQGVKGVGICCKVCVVEGKSIMLCG